MGVVIDFFFVFFRGHPWRFISFYIYNLYMYYFTCHIALLLHMYIYIYIYM